MQDNEKIIAAMCIPPLMVHVTRNENTDTSENPNKEYSCYATHDKEKILVMTHRFTDTLTAANMYREYVEQNTDVILRKMELRRMLEGSDAPNEHSGNARVRHSKRNRNTNVPVRIGLQERLRRMFQRAGTTI